MQTCYNCGKQVSDETLICPDCGALVKRYSAPVRQEELDLGAEQPESRPQNPDASAPRRASVWRDETGRVRYSGLLTAWLILCAVLAGYTALSYASLMIVYHNQAMYAQFFTAIPDFAEIKSVYDALMADIGQYYGIYIGMLAMCLLKCAAYIWLTAGKRKWALWAVVGCNGALIALMLVFGNAPYAVACALEAGATVLSMRRGLSLLR